MKIIAGPVDPLNKTEELLGKFGITYPVVYGMDTETICTQTGAFYEKDKKFIHPTCFLIRPDKTIEVTVYSSGPIGRFIPQDVLGLVRFHKSRAQK